MRRLLVNDALNQLGEHTFWNYLMEWFGCTFVGGSYEKLASRAAAISDGASLIIRNASWFPPIKTQAPTISLLQDIFSEGPQRKMQEEVIKSSRVTICNSEYTRAKYVPQFSVSNVDPIDPNSSRIRVIPLPVDFSLFEPGNPMGLQQALGLPDGCVCWIGASQGAAGHIKGFNVFLSVARANPDLNFVAVFKDAAPEVMPPNVRCYVRLPHEELVKVIGACRVGLCTSRAESQHLAGVEMGACGLTLVVPNVGTYWKREGIPGFRSANDDTPTSFYAHSIRVCLSNLADVGQTRVYWQKEFDKPVIREKWEHLVAEVEGTWIPFGDPLEAL